MGLRGRGNDWRMALTMYLMLTSLLLLATVIYFYQYTGRILYLAEFTAFLTPAMVANGSAVLAKRIKRSMHRGTIQLTPIDGGRVWRGKRLLGSNKTWEGLFFGSLSGVLAGEILSGAAWLLYKWRDSLLLSVASPYVSVAALLGDIASSFFKRRIGLMPGEPFPVCDQLDFYVTSILVLILLGFNMSVTDILLGALFVYSLHIVTNCLARQAGLKDECP